MPIWFAAFLFMAFGTSVPSVIGGLDPRSDKIAHSRGKLDTKPSINIVRGQDYYLCTEPGEPTDLVYFLHFNFMGEEVEVVQSNGNVVKAGKELTVRTHGTLQPGSIDVVTTRLTVNGKPLELSTTLMDCKRPLWGVGQ